MAKVTNHEELILFLFALMSFALYMFYKASVMSFNLMFCRFWQFAIGGLVSHWHSRDIFVHMIKRKIIIMLLLIIFIFLPHIKNDYLHLSRVFVTLFSSQLLVMDDINSESYLSKLLCYIGDASYSIYLIHWPIIVFYKFAVFSWGKFNFERGFVFCCARAEN